MISLYTDGPDADPMHYMQFSLLSTSRLATPPVFSLTFNVSDGPPTTINYIVNGTEIYTELSRVIVNGTGSITRVYYYANNLVLDVSFFLNNIIVNTKILISTERARSVDVAIKPDNSAVLHPSSEITVVDWTTINCVVVAAVCAVADARFVCVIEGNRSFESIIME